jgi:hypothetical protein
MALALLISQKLRVLHGAVRDESHADYSKVVVALTVLRHVDMTRARSGSGLPASGETRRREVASSILEVANGNWLLPEPVHLCGLGCCASESESVQKLTRATIDCVLGVIPDLPSLNRWSSVAANAAWWSAGVGLHSLVPQALSMLLPAGQDDELLESNSEDDWSTVQTKRLARGAQFLNNSSNKLRLLLLGSVQVPVDRFVASVSSTLSETACVTTQPAVLQRMIKADGFMMMLQQGLAANIQVGSPTYTLLRHHAQYSARAAKWWREWASETCSACLGMAAQVWLRLQAGS